MADTRTITCEQALVAAWYAAMRAGGDEASSWHMALVRAETFLAALPAVADTESQEGELAALDKGWTTIEVEGPVFSIRAADMEPIIATLRAATPQPVEGLREALERIRDLTLDVPAAHGNPESYYHGQLLTAIGTAARALAATNKPSRESAPKRKTSRLTLTELRDKAEASGITWWDDDWTRQDFLDAFDRAALSATTEPSDDPE